MGTVGPSRTLLITATVTAPAARRGSARRSPTQVCWIAAEAAHHRQRRRGEASKASTGRVARTRVRQEILIEGHHPRPSAGAAPPHPRPFFKRSQPRPPCGLPTGHPTRVPRTPNRGTGHASLRSVATRPPAPPREPGFRSPTARPRRPLTHPASAPPRSMKGGLTQTINQIHPRIQQEGPKIGPHWERAARAIMPLTWTFSATGLSWAAADVAAGLAATLRRRRAARARKQVRDGW